MIIYDSAFHKAHLRNKTSQAQVQPKKLKHEQRTRILHEDLGGWYIMRFGF